MLVGVGVTVGIGVGVLVGVGVTVGVGVGVLVGVGVTVGVGVGVFVGVGVAVGVGVGGTYLYTSASTVKLSTPYHTRTGPLNPVSGSALLSTAGSYPTYGSLYTYPSGLLNSTLYTPSVNSQNR